MTQYRVRTWLVWDVAIILSALGLAACGRMLATDAFLALQIKQVQVLSGGGCTVPATASSVLRSSGTLDLDLPNVADGVLPPYVLPVLVANNLASLGGAAGEEENNITLTHFTVELSAANVKWDSSCPSTFDTQAFTLLIPPGGSVGASLQAITPSHSACIRPNVPAQHLVVTAKVWAKGHHGGTSIESAPFIYPIDVCMGCEQEQYTDPTLVVYRYPADYPLCASLAGSNPYTGDPCLPPGQDETILCCGVSTTQGGAPKAVAVCPGVFTGTTSTATSTDTTTATGP